MYNPLLPAGQTVMSNSNPVVIASDQSAVAVKPGASWGIAVANFPMGQASGVSSIPVVLNADLQGITVRIINTDLLGATIRVGSGTITTVTTLTNITNQGQIVDNALFTDATTRVMMGGYVYDEVAGTPLTENDGAAARINVNRAQVHVLESGISRGVYVNVGLSGALLTDNNNGVTVLNFPANQIVSYGASVTVGINTGISISNASAIGGGVQYAEGLSLAIPTGTVAMWQDDANSIVYAAGSSRPLPVDLRSSVMIGVTITNPGAISAGGASQVIPLQSSGLSLHVNIDNGVSVKNFPTDYALENGGNLDLLGGAVSGGRVQTDVISIPDIHILDSANNNPFDASGILKVDIQDTSIPITAGESINVGINGNVTISNTGFNISGGSIANAGFGASITNFPLVQIVGITNIPTVGVTNNVKTIPGSSWQVGIYPGSSISVGLYGGLSINNQGFGVSVTNFPATQVVAYGASVTVTILNTGFGASVTNFPANQIVSYGASVTVALNTNPTIAGGSITNSSFGASVTNFPVVQIVGVTNIVNTRTDSSTLMAGTSQRTPTFATIDLGSAGDNTVVAGLSGLAIRVLDYAFTVGVSTIVLWKSGASGTLLSGRMQFGAPGGIDRTRSEYGLMQTGVSLPLIMNLSAGSSIGGQLTYITV